MRASRISYLIILLALCGYSSAYGQSRPQTQATPSPSPTQVRELKNQDVIEMVGAGLTENVIIAKIKASPHNFKTDIDALKELKEAKVPESIVTLMIELSSDIPTTPESQPKDAPTKQTTNESQPEKSKELIAAEKVIAAIRRLDNATAVGVLFQNYSSLLIESKSIVDENIKDVNDPDFRRGVEKAMLDYQYAMYVWNLAVTNGWAYFYSKQEPGRTLITSYGVPIKISVWTKVPVLTGLSHVWLSARNNFNYASNRLIEMSGQVKAP